MPNKVFTIIVDGVIRTIKPTQFYHDGEHWYQFPAFVVPQAS